MGRVTQSSRPHAAGATVYWTINRFDAIGRRKTVKAPNGASITCYNYWGSLVGVTDPAGKWKTFQSDAAGNLVPVNEPNPAGGADFISTYTYDFINGLRTVTMARQRARRRGRLPTRAGC